MLKTLGAQIKEFKKDSFLTPVFMILEVLMETVIPLMMASIIDNGVEKGDIHHIYVMGGLMIVTACVSLFAGVMGGKYGARASTGFARNLRKAMYENIQTFSFSNIDKFSTAGLVTRLTTDVTNIQMAYQMILRMCVRAPITLVCAMIMAFFINAKLACIYLAAVILLGIILAFITVRAHKYFTQVFPKYDDLNASVQENVSAIRVVKAYVREDFEKDRFKKASENIYKMFVKAEGVLAFNSPVMQIAVYSCIIALSWLGAKMIVAGSLTTGELMSLLAYCMNILMSLMMLSMVFVMIIMSRASAERIVEILNEKSDLTNGESPVTEVKDGSVVFDHVSFSYTGKKDKICLSDINLNIRSGETVGIIGGTGSGKSSLVHMIPRFYDATEGSVRINGQDVKSYRMDDLRQHIGIVMQKAVLFHGTIRENIRWGAPEATDEQINEALELAQAAEVVAGKPEGLDYEIEQGGRNLSGGQRQRFTIARALVRKPSVLILDDSASALDFATDAKLRKALAGLKSTSTIFIVSQRTSSIQHADKILVLDDGKLVGMGTHEELLENCSVYKEIYDSQFKKPEETTPSQGKER